MAQKVHIALFHDPRRDGQYTLTWDELDSWSHLPRTTRLIAPLQARTRKEAVSEAARILAMSPHQVG